MNAAYCDPLKTTDLEGYQICRELLIYNPNIRKRDFDTGVPEADYSTEPYKIIPAKPDGKVSSEEVRQLALKLATSEYKLWIKEMRRTESSSRKDTSLLASKLKKHGMFVPWFFYSDASVKTVLSKLKAAGWSGASSGNLESAAKLMYRFISSKAGLGVTYSTDTELKEMGIEDLIGRGKARCEELAFLEKGLAMLMEISEPRVHDTLYSDSDLDHVYSSFDLPQEESLFFDPLLKPVVAKEHPKGTAPIVSDLHLLGIYEMNATSRNCKSTSCYLERSKRAVASSPIYRNHYLLGNSYLMDNKYKKAKQHYSLACKLKPDYFFCK